MTHGGEPRAQARLGVWLGVSLLAHALALPLLRTGAAPEGGGGDGLRVTLVATARPASAPPSPSSARAATEPPADTGSERRRGTERVRESRSQRAPVTPPPSPRIVADSPPTSAANTDDRPVTPTGMAPTPVAPGAGRAVAALDREASSTPAAGATGTQPRNQTRTVADATAASDAASPVVTRVTASPEVGGRNDAPVAADAANGVARHNPQPSATPSPTHSTATTEPARSPTPHGRVSSAEASAETLMASTGHSANTLAGAATTATASSHADDTTAAAAETLASSLGAGADSALLALLHTAIDKQKRYPSLARRQRREGTATVLFRLHPDGALDDLELHDSSGFDLLDKAALRAVAGVAPFEPATRYLRGDKQFRVEVEFRLF